MKAPLTYGFHYGPGFASDPFDWEVELTEEEAAIYTAAVKAEEDLNAITELKPALNRAYPKIVAYEQEQNGLDETIPLIVSFVDSWDL